VLHLRVQAGSAPPSTFGLGTPLLTRTGHPVEDFTFDFLKRTWVKSPGGAIGRWVFHCHIFEHATEFTSDGRYLTFIRHRSSDGHDLLLVWDTTTGQTISSTDLGSSNPNVAPGTVSRSDGSTSPYLQQLFVKQISCCQTLIFLTSQPTSSGLLIQRIVGHQRLFGQRVPKLQNVGRFPLGKFGNGRHKTHWDFTVNGRKLPPGQYYVTLRAITAKLGVRDLSRPFLVTIHKHNPPTVQRA
jgi:hypothetical protein